jgi:hypothetical protein
MRSFIYKTIIITVFLFVIDYIVGFSLDRLFTDLPSRESETSTIYRSLNTESADVLILGSSTANHHYNSLSLSDSLSMSVFNAGVDGFDILYSDIVYQSFVDRKDLKYVIIDIGEANVDGSWINRISYVRRYYGRNKAVTDFFDKETDWQQKIKLYSNLYRYNSSLNSIVSLLFFDRSPDNNNGYRPLYGSKSFEFKTINYFKPNAKCINHLTNIIEKCREKGTKVLIVKSPEAIYNSAFVNWLQSFADSNSVSLLLECDNPIWRERKDLFYDGSHLNSDGSEILTRNVCKKLLSLQ